MSLPSGKSPEHSVAVETFRGTLWNHAGKLVEYGAMYVISVFVARGLGVEQNGEFAALVSFSQLLLVAASFGLETSLNKFIPQLEKTTGIDQTRYLFRRVILLRILLYLAVAFFGIALHTTIEIEALSSLEPYLFLLFLYTALRAITPLFSILLTAQLKIALSSRINVLTRLVELAGVLFLWSSGMSIVGLFALFIGTSIVQIVAFLVLSRHNIFGTERPASIHPLITFGSIFWVNTIVDFFLGRQGDILFLRTLLSSPTYASLYDVAFSVAQLAFLGTTIGFSGITLATFARLSGKQRGEIDDFYLFLVRLTSLLTIPLSAFLLVNPSSVLSALYPSGFSEAAVLIQGMVSFRIVARLLGGGENAEFLLAKGMVSRLVVVSIVGASVNVILNLILIPLWMGVGAVIAGGFGNLVANILAWRLVFSVSHLRLQVTFWTKLVAVCIAASSIVSFMKIGEGAVLLLGQGTVFLAVFAGLMAVVKPFGVNDMSWFGRMNVRIVRILKPFTSHVTEGGT
ncbi:MAG TPA: oligosaccharide flippase family protein [Bacteroidota bacterium]